MHSSRLFSAPPASGPGTALPHARLTHRLSLHPSLRPPFACAALAITVGMTLPGGALNAQTRQAQPPTTPDTSLPAISVKDSTPASPQIGPLLDQPNRTASRLPLTPRQTPASVTVIDRQAIESLGAENTQDILKGAPGITAHDAPGSVNVSYRGFSSASVTQLFNGVDLQYSIAARPVDSWIYDRVEVVGGASGFLYGAGGVGGTINNITKEAVEYDITEGRTRLGSHRLKEISVGLNRRLAGEADDPQRHFGRLDLNHRHGDGWADHSRERSTQLAGSVLSTFGADLRHVLAYEFQDERIDRPYWGTPLLNPQAGALRVDERTRRKNYNSADGLYAQRVHWARSVTEWQPHARLSLRNTLYLYDGLRDYRNVEVYEFNDDNTLIDRTEALLQRHDQRLIGNRLEARYQGQLAGRRSDWVLGLEISQNRQARFPSVVDGVIGTVDPFVFQTEHFFDIPGMPRDFVLSRDNKVRTDAIFLENRTALTSSLQLMTALRHERIRLDLTNHRTPTPSSPAHLSHQYHPTTGRLALVWEMSPNAMSYVQYSTAADPPSGTLSTAGFGTVRNNLKLTRGQQWEVGTKLDFWERKGSATLAAYRIARNDFATRSPLNRSEVILIGEQFSTGVELSVGLRPTPRWSVEGNLGILNAEYRNHWLDGVSLAGKTPDNTPERVINLWTTYQFSPALQASASLRHVGKIYADAANTRFWPSHTLLDLGLSYRLSQQLTLNGRIRNVTDEVYAREVTSVAYLGAPRTVDLSLHMRF
ncbi:MAG: TonB-dependent siderophore receptor [Lautropia sp.]|nr:TonB-dependent siderophore receptor [Lautropia sp.]